MLKYISWKNNICFHPYFSEVCSYYSDVIMGTIASQITSLTIVYATVYSDADLRKHQSSASLAFVRGSHRGPVNSPHKWPVTRKMFPFDDVIIVPNKPQVITWISEDMGFKRITRAHHLFAGWFALKLCCVLYDFKQNRCIYTALCGT